MTRRYTRAEFETLFDHMFGAVLLGATPQPINEFSAVQRHPI
ncbi:unnamed protein product, partial [marine sediment metagenome]